MATFWEETKLAAQELFGKNETKLLKKRVHDGNPNAAKARNEEGEAEEEEPLDLYGEVMVVDQPIGAWERITSRMAASPIFEKMKKAAEAARETKVGQAAEDAKDTVNDRLEDVREAWETSQNPWVYRLSSLWDSVSYETEEAMAVREFRRADPNFSLEVWEKEVSQDLLPEILGAWMRGDMQFLKQWWVRPPPPPFRA
mmetsp:Transcript_49052/g.138848  ORF Transcript_49052/g.138848 Transcript_49052/m.138848 type:complete len:199 (+) Transcript_49052:1007-1603(+)